MSGSSDDSSVPEVRKERKKGNKNTRKVENSPSKVQRSALFMCVDVSEKEIKYRQTLFKDEKKVVSSHRINCTACGADMKHLVHDGREVFNHPVLKVLMCKSCVKFYGDGSFSPDEDGSDRFCRWCAQGGTLYCCAECTCAFCKKCIKNNLKRSILDDIEEEDWKCFVCNVKPLWELRAVCAAAQSCANQVRRNKKKEIGENLKEMQKKMPEKTQNRRSNRWQTSKPDDSVEAKAEKKRKRLRSTSSESEPDSADHKDKKQKGRRKKDEDVIQIGSSDAEVEQSKLKSNQTKKQLKDKKRNARESDSDDSSIAAKLRKKDISSHLQKQNKEKFKDKPSKKVEQYDSTKGNVSDGSKPKRLPKNISCADEGNPSFPKVTDKGTAQWFCHWLKDLGQDIIDQSNLCSNNVTKVIEKKVAVEKMMNTKTAEKTVNVLQTLIELTSENLERAKGLLTLNHKYWRSRVIKISKELHDDDDNDDSESDDDKPLKSRSKPINEEHNLRARKQTVRNLSEVSSNDSEEERTVIKKKKNKKKKKADSVAVKNKHNLSDSDETHLSGAENKINHKQKASKKVEDTSKSQNNEVESSSSKDDLCNGTDEVPQNDSAASSNEDSTMNEGLAAKLCKENLEEVSKESKKNLKKNERTAENQEVGDSESTEEKQKGLENDSSSPSKKESETLENGDESMKTSEKIEKQLEITAISSPEDQSNISAGNLEEMETTAISSPEDQSNNSTGNLEEISAAEEDKLGDTSEDIFDASTDKITQECNTKNKQKSTKADKSSSNKESKQSKETGKAGCDGEGKGKSSEGGNDDDDDADAGSVGSAETLECLYSNEQETSLKGEKMDINSQTTEKENASDVESSQKSFSVDIKEEKIVSSQEAKLLEKMDLTEEVVNKEKEDQLKQDSKNETAENGDSNTAENKNSTSTEKDTENTQEVPSEEKSEEESKYTEGGCKAQQSLLGYSSDDENDREENEEDSDSEKAKKKKRKKGKSLGITGTSTPLKKKTETKSKRSKKGDDLLPSDIDSEDSEEEENLENRRAKSKIKSKKEEDKQKTEATKESEGHNSSDSKKTEATKESEGHNSSDSSDGDAEKKQTKDKDIKSTAVTNPQHSHRTKKRTASVGNYEAKHSLKDCFVPLKKVTKVTKHQR